MTTMHAFTKQQGLRLCGWLTSCALAAGAAAAQTPAPVPAPRIRSEISYSSVTQLANSPRLYADGRFDAGRMPADTPLTGITMVFNRTAAQQADLTALLAAQQNPSSPLFHQWLTPEQFGARFGMAQADLDKVQQWLQQQGFTIDSVARARNSIRFSGTVNRVNLAFQTEMHYYKTPDGARHLSPSTPLSLPSAIAPTIEAIHDLIDLKPRPSYQRSTRPARPAYSIYQGTSPQVVLFAPGDIDIAYDINPLIQSGTTGTGQTIAIMGQSQITTTDITNFQDAALLAEKTPNLILVPNTGAAAVSPGDEGESDLDLEWSGATAPGATIDFVYTGNSPTSNGIFDSLQYAIDNNIGNIISVSYGSCETELAGFTQDPLYQQAEMQGQSIIAASGDSGSTGCVGLANLTTAQQQALAVSYPASSQYVTGVGGTEISSTDDAVGPYFSAALSTGNGTALTTALSYIPEVAWNDDSVANGIGSSGGGVSTLYTTQPSYQSAYFTATGETNPDSTARLVPDVALYSSPDLPGYLYCTSDQSDWYNGAQGGQPQAASCGASEFFDDITGYFNVAGGTSFAAPIFAGMMALVNQKAGYTTGQGLLNPTLYSLASNSATAFHDVTSGNNYCTAGTANGCPSNGATLGYAAGAGYDLVTGLGSVDVNALATAYPASTSTLIATSTTLSAANTAPLVNTADNITIAVASDTGATVPTGTVSVSVNGGTPATYTLTANGTYVDAVTFTTAGTATVVANYSGDATHAASTGTVSVTVGGVSTGKGSITLAATNLTLTAGNNGNSTVTVTPAGGYQGTVGLQLSASNSNLSFCYTLSNVVVSGTAATFTTQLNIDTNLNDCNQGAVRKGTTAKHLFVSGHNSARLNQGPSTGFGPALGLACIFAGLFGWRQRRFRVFLSLLVLAGFGLTLTACGGVTNNNNFTSKGTYTLTLTGTDSVTSTITNTTTFTLVVQ